MTKLATDNRGRLRSFYQTMASKYPHGTPKNIWVTIGGRRFTAIAWEIENGRFSFGLFLARKRYSRKTLIVYKSGTLEEDTVGILPKFDQVSHEPDFEGISNMDIALTVADAITKR